jgi:AraC-like DNA-binding protein
LFDEELGILKLKELMMILLKSENHQNIRILLSDIFTQINIKFKEVIEKNLFSNLSMAQLAFISNMSLSTFKRTFKETFSTTPARYIKFKKLEKAVSLLLCNDDSITDIAYGVSRYICVLR